MDDFSEKIMQLCMKDEDERKDWKKNKKSFRSNDIKQCEQCSKNLVGMKQFGVTDWYDGQLAYKFKQHVCNDGN